MLWITLFSGKIGVFGGMCSLMTYIETKLKREIVIDSIITIHYFEYMRDFVFRGESHDFWEFMYVDKGSVIVQGENISLHFTPEILFFMNQMSFMRSAQSEILHQILLLSLLSVILRQWVNSVEKR